MNAFKSMALTVLLILATSGAANANLNPYEDDYIPPNPADSGGEVWKFIWGTPVRANVGDYLGSLNHNVFWPYCSGKGYQSYYDQGINILCGQNAWDAKNPEGDYFSYDTVCEETYGHLAHYDEKRRGCVSQDN
jgi:hypothetical protein